MNGICLYQALYRLRTRTLKNMLKNTIKLKEIANLASEESTEMRGLTCLVTTALADIISEINSLIAFTRMIMSNGACTKRREI